MTQIPHPLPSDMEVPSFSDKLIQKIPDGVWEILYFIDDHILWFVCGLCFILFIKFVISRLYKRREYIMQIWTLVLFFLTKRQMLIPLVITLGKRSKILCAKQVDKLLKVREKCSTISLKENPKSRMAEERILSEILLEYFQKIKKPTPKIKKLICDFEFIDSKLIQVQAQYNQEVFKWNKFFSRKIVSKVFKFFSLGKLEPFV